MRRRTALAAGGGALAAAGCASGQRAAAFEVVTSTTLLADLIARVAVGRARVTPLVPAEVSPHRHLPTQEQVVAAAKARRFLASGVGYDAAFFELVVNAARRAGGPLPAHAPLASGLPVLQSDVGHGDHAPGFANPFLHLDAQHAVAYVERCRDALATLDPEGAAGYRTRAEGLMAELRELDTWIAGQVAQVPAERRKILKDEDSFVYFGRRYGFQTWAISETGIAAAGLTPQQYFLVVRSAALFVGSGPRVIFGEAGSGTAQLQQFAGAASLRYVPGLYAATVGRGAELDSYVKVMRHNTRLLVEKLRAG